MPDTRELGFLGKQGCLKGPRTLHLLWVQGQVFQNRKLPFWGRSSSSSQLLAQILFVIPVVPMRNVGTNGMPETFEPKESAGLYGKIHNKKCRVWFPFVF